MLGSKGENGWLSEDYSRQVNLIGAESASGHTEKSAEKTAISGVPAVSSPIQESQGQGKPLQFPGGLNQEKRFHRH